MHALGIVQNDVPSVAVGAVGERPIQDERIMLGGAAESPW
jgi:hypothetical protein